MSQAPPRLLIDRRQFLQVLVGATAAEIVGGQAAPAMAAGELPLEYQTNAYIKRLRRAGRIPPDEHTAWSVYDFTAGQKLVSINENQPLQTASMIKPFLAQAYFFRHQADKRGYPFDKRIRLKMERMIRHSDNRAANFFINRVGGDRPVHQRPREVERVLKHYAGGIFLQTSIVEFIPHNGRSYRNKASANDYSRFLRAMSKNQLPYISHIKYFMGLPNRDRIKDGTVSVPRCAKLYHKTGTTAHVCGDMGMLVVMDRHGKPYRYTFIGVIQKDSPAQDYGGWMRDRGNVIREVSDIVYTFMRKRYNLAG
jgi:beta-lactamase class A